MLRAEAEVQTLKREVIGVTTRHEETRKALEREKAARMELEDKFQLAEGLLDIARRQNAQEKEKLQNELSQQRAAHEGDRQEMKSLVEKHRKDIAAEAVKITQSLKQEFQTELAAKEVTWTTQLAQCNEEKEQLREDLKQMTEKRNKLAQIAELKFSDLLN